MKLYTVEFFNSDTIGFFSNKKKAMSFLRHSLKYEGETEGCLSVFEIPFGRKYNINVSGWTRSNDKLFQYLRHLIIEYIDERMDGIPPEPILILSRSDIRR